MTCRLAVVVNRFPTLSETFIFNKVSGLVKLGYDVSVIVQDTRNDGYAYKESLAGFDNFRLYKAFTKGDVLNPFFYFRILNKFRESVRFILSWRHSEEKHVGFFRSYLMWLTLADGYDVIHFEFTGLAIRFISVFKYLKPAKIATSCRGAAEQIKPLIDRDRAMELRRLFQLVDMVHCVSDDMFDTCHSLYGLTSEKAFVNRPAIDASKFISSGVRKYINGNPLTFCSTGRLHWKKGFEYALLAMKELKAKGYSFKYEVIGGGVEMEKLLFMVQDLELADSVTFLGSLPSIEIRNRLDNCDIFILPSLSEGISNSVLEALAMEVPVIATKAGGMEEVIQDGETGLLTDNYDVKQLASKLVLLIEDIAMRERLGQNGRKIVLADFTLESQMKRFAEWYTESLLDRV